jgi:hypothetical protein
LVWGYFYGILKAHYIGSNGLFIFDASTVGLYLGLLTNGRVFALSYRFQMILPWVLAMIAWPIFISIIPIQHYVVQVIGLRGNIFWLPMILVGFVIQPNEKTKLVLAMAVLNIISLGFAVGEFVLGVEYFVPENEVTRIVYNSNDLKDGAKRIPSIFVNAHSYSLFMTATIPWILGEILGRRRNALIKVASLPILIAGLVSALLGVFMAGPRQPVVVLGLILVLIIFSGRFNLAFLVITGLSGAIVGYFVAQDERMQRFTQLQDLESVQARIQSSISMDFVDVMMSYPMGNGMGAGGTSLPSFAQDLLTNAVLLENEYARIMLEQGVPGLFLFLAFCTWYMLRQASRKDVDFNLKSYVRYSVFVSIATAFIGVGLMTSIPGTAFLFLGIGYSISPAFYSYLNPENTWFFQVKNISRSDLPAFQRGLARA